MKRTWGVQLATYGVSIALASFAWERPAFLALCYVAISLGMLFHSHTPSDVVFYVVAVVLGPTGEAVAVHFGAWQYARPLYLVPIWLPFLWGIAALTTKRLAEAGATLLAQRRSVP